MDATALLLFCVALVLAASSPGPSVAALVARVLSSGWRGVLPFLLAMWLGEVFWLTAAVAGLSALVETFHTAFVVVKYVGIAYLLYLAWRMWTAPVTVANDAALPRADGPVRMFMAGLSVTLGNPKLMVFYLALLPTIIDMAAITLADWIVLSLVTLLILAAIDLTYVWIASQMRRLLRSPRAMQIANRVNAGALGTAAGVMAVR